MRLDATLRKLSLIGEAAMRVPDDIRAAAPGIPWRKIVATRKRLMRAYPGTDQAVGCRSWSAYRLMMVRGRLKA